jgi:hypothetical protein
MSAPPLMRWSIYWPGGQGVFGIAVGASLPGLRADVQRFPAETVSGEREPYAHDELAAKRRSQVA